MSEWPPAPSLLPMACRMACRLKPSAHGLCLMASGPWPMAHLWPMASSPWHPAPWPQCHTHRPWLMASQAYLNGLWPLARLWPLESTPQPPAPWPLAHGMPSMCYGLWRKASGPMASGLRPLAHGLWPMACQAWPMAPGLAYGMSNMSYGLWPMASSSRHDTHILWPLAHGLWHHGLWLMIWYTCRMVSDSMASGPIVAGLWYLAHRLSPLPSGPWHLKHVLWPLSHGLWLVACPSCLMASGLWPLAMATRSVACLIGLRVIGPTFYSPCSVNQGPTTCCGRQSPTSAQRSSADTHRYSTYSYHQELLAALSARRWCRTYCFPSVCHRRPHQAGAHSWPHRHCSVGVR